MRRGRVRLVRFGCMGQNHLRCPGPPANATRTTPNTRTWRRQTQGGNAPDPGPHCAAPGFPGPLAHVLAPSKTFARGQGGDSRWVTVPADRGRVLIQAPASSQVPSLAKGLKVTSALKSETRSPTR